MDEIKAGEIAKKELCELKQKLNKTCSVCKKLEECKEENEKKIASLELEVVNVMAQVSDGCARLGSWRKESVVLAVFVAPRDNVVFEGERTYFKSRSKKIVELSKASVSFHFCDVLGLRKLCKQNLNQMTRKQTRHFL